MATNPKRRYIRNQGFQQALDSLDSVFQARIEDKAVKAAKKEELMTKLLLNDISRIDQYKDTLVQSGITLPDEFQTTDFTGLIEDAISSNNLVALSNLKKQSSNELAQLQGVLGGYTQGKNLTRRLVSEINPETGFAYAHTPSSEGLAGDTDIQSLIFSESEFSNIPTDMLGNYELMDENMQNIFKQGFMAGNYNNDEALTTVTNMQNLTNAKLDLNNKMFDQSEEWNNEYLTGVGKDIESQIEAGGIQYSDMLAYYNEENIDTFTGFLESLREGTDFGLSKNSIVGRKIADAMSDQGAFKAGEGGFNNLSLVQLGVFSKQTRADYVKILLDNQLNEEKLEYLKIHEPKLYNTTIRQLSEKSPTFKALHNIREDLIKVRLWNSPHNKRALDGLMLADEINDGRFREAQNITSTLISQGLMDDFDMEEPVNISDGSGYDLKEIMSAFDESIVLPEDEEGALISAQEGVLDVDFGDPEAALAALEHLEKIEGDYKINKKDYQNSFSSLGMYGGSQVWMNPNREGFKHRMTSGLPGIHYIVDEVEMGNLKHQFLNKTLQWLNPNKQSGLANIPFLTFVLPGQGQRKAIENISWVQDEIAKFNTFIDNTNKLRIAKGLPALENLDSEQILKDYSNIAKEDSDVNNRHDVISKNVPAYEKGYHKDGSFWRETSIFNQGIELNQGSSLGNVSIMFDSIYQ